MSLLYVIKLRNCFAPLQFFCALLCFFAVLKHTHETSVQQSACWLTHTLLYDSLYNYLWTTSQVKTVTNELQERQPKLKWHASGKNKTRSEWTEMTGHTNFLVSVTICSTQRQHTTELIPRKAAEIRKKVVTWRTFVVYPILLPHTKSPPQ